MKNWNFRGYIAIELEEYSKQFLGDNAKTADEIECGAFVETMFSISDKRFKEIETIDFVSLCSNYLDLPASQIPVNQAIKIFEEFQRLIKTI